MAIDFTAPAEARMRSHWFRYDAVGPLAMAVDVVAIVGASLAGGMIHRRFVPDGPFHFSDYLALGLLFAMLFVLLVQIRGLYRPLELLKPLRQIFGVVTLWAVVVGFLAMVGFALKLEQQVPRGVVFLFIVIGTPLLVLLRLFWQRLLVTALANGTFATRRIALVGGAAQLDDGKMVRRLAPFGLSVVVRVRLPLDDEAGIKDAVADAVAALRGSNVDEIVVVLDGSRFELVERVVSALRILPLPVRLTLDAQLSDIVSRPTQRFGSVVAVEMHRAPMSLVERGAKRALDVAIASTALFLISPLLILTACAVRLDSPGPVLFRQTRNGFNNRPFRILKFRSMRVMEDGAVVRQASRQDSRVTAVGRLIRRLSIDELPQLWNVLRGEMSIVGPRPHALAHDTHYEKLIGDYPYRQHVKPGLTGWAQINGSRGETPTTDSMAERVRLDIWYVENWSIWLDIRVIARTFTALLNVKHTY